MDPRKLCIKDFTYVLPEQQIARYPVAERDAARLLVYHNHEIGEDIFRNLHHHLPAGSLLILNDTRVLAARLLFQKKTGGIIEIFCLEPGTQYPDITAGMMQRGHVQWHCLIGGASKWKRGQVLEKKINGRGGDFLLYARYVEKNAGAFIVDFSWTDDSRSFSEVLRDAGVIPLPPYLKREAEKSDTQSYQTIYASEEGSVAAPTAGLHFTNNIFQNLKAKNIQTCFITLHVGAGTFKPVKTEMVGEHEMHVEFISLSKHAIEAILDNLNGAVIAVGTTSLRAIESMYWSAVKLRNNEDHLHITQWYPYEYQNNNLSAREALESLLEFMTKTNSDSLTIRTEILIAPPYTLRIAHGLITNFHLPQSTLLLLVAALTGNDWKKIYQYALKNNFRFLSYGDGSLLWDNRFTRERV